MANWSQLGLEVSLPVGCLSGRWECRCESDAAESLVGDRAADTCVGGG